ncbi:uncharacterized protein LOC115747671 [Rhodamnia argentea]|uniref:Uncharacterized protein LOC115747671 n=1 Tax=Rhodamnia argentea TaxID=178133 RepID=A0A8B8PY87_9MYRT|nr:uncharacterized protein LOC115747671 [Rhodamnia argentea]
MASGQTVSAILSSSVLEDDVESSDGTDDPYLDGQHHPQARGNLSRLSVCNSSFSCPDDDVDMGVGVDEEDVYADFYGGGGGGGGGGPDDAPGGVGAAAVVSSYLSRLSVESLDGDADEELSDEKERLPGWGAAELTSDSGEERECYSLPATPPRRRNRGGCGGGPAKWSSEELKEYASESEGGACGRARKYARRRIIRERFVSSSGGESNKLKRDDCCCNSFSGESEGGGGLMVITRPKGGRRSLCMDLEEVKACRDLGFELEHERMVEMPSRLSISGSTLDTSSGGNSPIGNWRISSPGDDPRDVKARLKVWAQAVALASTSRHGN